MGRDGAAATDAGGGAIATLRWPSLLALLELRRKLVPLLLPPSSALTLWRRARSETLEKSAEVLLVLLLLVLLEGATTFLTEAMSCIRVMVGVRAAGVLVDGRPKSLTSCVC